jgi:hypothetical protein
MNYPHIAQKLYGEPWAITPAAHSSMQQVFEAHLNGDKTQQVIFTRNQFNSAALVLDPPRDRTSRVYRRGRLAYVPVHGIIGKGLSLMEEMCGGYSIDQLEKDLDECNATRLSRASCSTLTVPVVKFPECLRRRGSSRVVKGDVWIHGTPE